MCQVPSKIPVSLHGADGAIQKLGCKEMPVVLILQTSSCCSVLSVDILHHGLIYIKKIGFKKCHIGYPVVYRKPNLQSNLQAICW